MKKVFALILSMLMLVSTLVVMPVNAVAENEAEFTQISDSPTVNDWKDWFNESSTEHAGGVWTDKSVFNSAADFLDASDEQENAKAVSGLQVAENNFLVSLSTIASTKSIVGYSNLPTDTMLVLDMSTSMINNHSIDELTIAANKAMQELLVLNNHNRVGVVIYAGNTTGGFNQNAPGATVVLLPLDRYTSTRDVDGDGVNDYLNYRKVNGNSEWNNMFIVSGVKNSNGTTMSGEKTTSSGTFIQDGIYVALQQFLRNDIEAVIPEGQIQAGTERIPIMVIMTDGEPTLAVTDYDGNNGSLGANELNFMTHGYDDITFLSQLTASYAKQQIDLKYGTNSTLFYTLGLNVDESQALVMNPDPNYEGADEDLVERFNGYWNSLKTNGSAYLVDARR
ncbi:MAG: VWA domain-containing protein, partial [Erysipelotrichaceae bacterium]|nr:VWA domain-containing protein [Erysipelotrichaceae bacterium]